MLKKFRYVLTYSEEPCLEETLELRLATRFDLRDYYYSQYYKCRLDLVLEGLIFVDIFQNLFFNFEFIFQNIFVTLP